MIHAVNAVVHVLLWKPVLHRISRAADIVVLPWKAYGDLDDLVIRERDKRTTARTTVR